LPGDQKKELGKVINELKNKAQDKINFLKENLSDSSENSSSGLDLTRPGDVFEVGSRHPLSLVRNEILNIFKRIGFTVADGPEIEDDWHNFTALNFPENHPARDMQDTFFISQEGSTDSIALRTHTSSIQVRIMENSKPPIRILAPGSCLQKRSDLSESALFFSSGRRIVY
jgi:phenylalanyl-tRNA synthetase alpha chain